MGPENPLKSIDLTGKWGGGLSLPPLNTPLRIRVLKFSRNFFILFLGSKVIVLEFLPGLNMGIRDNLKYQMVDN